MAERMFRVGVVVVVNDDPDNTGIPLSDDDVDYLALSAARVEFAECSPNIDMEEITEETI